MGIGKIIQLVGVLIAVVAGVMGGFVYSALLVALLGLVGGWFIEKDDRQRFLVATIALLAVQGALGVTGQVGRPKRQSFGLPAESSARTASATRAPI